MKRIYWNSIFTALGSVGAISFGVLFYYLIIIGAVEITGHSGDMVCSGTINNPCIAIINFTAKEDIFLYPMGYDPYGRNTPFGVDKPLKSWKMYRSWGNYWREIKLNDTCTGSWCGCYWCTKSNKAKYSYVFRKGRNYSIKIEAFKENPEDTIKWSFDKLDPFWYGTTDVNSLNLELGSNVEITSNLSGADAVCVDIDHPDYGDEYKCGDDNVTFNFNISYFRKTEFNDSSTTKNISWVDGGNQTVYINSHQYDEMVDFTMNLTGFISNSTYPGGVKIYINDTLIKDIGLIYDENTTTNLEDGNTSKEYNFTSSINEFTDYFSIPLSANVTNATMNITGKSLDPSSETYDNIDDSSVNYTLWRNSTTYSYSTPVRVVSVSEDSDKLTLHVKSQHTGGKDGPLISGWVGTSNLSHKNVENLTFQFNCSNTGGISTTTKLYVFGNEILNKSKGTADSSVWTVVRNNTGQDTFEVYDDDVHSKQIIASDDDIRATGTAYGGGTQSDMYGYFFYVNYYSRNLPSEFYLEVGTPDGDFEFNITGDFDTENQTTSFADEINSYLSTCSNESDYCNVPFILYSETSGSVEIDNINISHEYGLNPFEINITNISNFLGNSSGETDIPIIFNSEKNGTLQLDDVRFDHAGGNDTIDVLVYEGVVNDHINETVETDDVGEYSSIALDSYGYAHISHYHSVDDDLRYCNNTQGSWSCTAVDTSGDRGKYSSIAVDSNDKLHISHVDETTDDLRYCNNTAGSWSCTAVDTIGIVGDYSSIAVDNGNNIHISHYDNSNDNLDYCNNTQGSWSCTAVDTGAGNYGYYSSIAIDSNNYAHIAEYENVGDNLKYCNNTQGSWSCTSIETSGNVGLRCSIAIDSNDVVHISHYDYTNYDLRYCNNTQGSWSCTAVDTSGDVGDFSSIAIDTKDNVYISHYDSDASDLRYCDDTGGSWNCTIAESSDSAWLGTPYGRALAIKKGRLVDSSESSAYGHMSWQHNSNLTYTKKSVRFDNKSNNDTLNITNYFSDWFYDFPSYVDYLEFIPGTPTSKNVTPFGQTPNTPIFNITTTNYGGKDMNLSIKVNETYSCVNFTFSNDSSKSNGTLMSSTNWYNISYSLNYNSNPQVWMWADYNCSFLNWTLWYPQLDIRGCCENCICGEDI